MCTQAKPFCAVCVEYIVGKPNYDEIDGVTYVVCKCCSTSGAKLINGRLRFQSAKRISDAERLRAQRKIFKDRGLCMNSGNHGAATDGVYCFTCAERNRNRNRGPRVVKPRARGAIVHGKIYTYKVLKCRCDQCRTANKVYEERRRGRLDERMRRAA